MFDDFPATLFAENGMLAALDAFAFVQGEYGAGGI